MDDEEKETQFSRTLRLMRAFMQEAMVGLGALEKAAEKWLTVDGDELTVEQAKELMKEVRQLMALTGFEGCSILMQAMLLAGDPMLAEICGLELERPKGEIAH